MIAEFLSPRIARLRRLDPTVTFLEIRSLGKDGKGQFRDVLLLGSGSDLMIDASNQECFKLIFEELENSELCFLIMSEPESAITATNVIDRLQMKRKLNIPNLKEVEFAASHFHEFSIDSLARLNDDELYEILSSDSLLISSEDSLFEFVQQRAEMDSSNFRYFEFVRFEFLSTSSISTFVDLTSKASNNEFHIYECINSTIWCSICRRLVQATSDQRVSDRVVKRGREFAVTSSLPFCGIISYLTSTHGGNVYDRGIVDVTASSNYGAEYLPKYAVDLSCENGFGSQNVPNQWLCYDYKELRIIPSGYSIRSGLKTWDKRCYLRSWVIETSMDGSTWNVVDRRDRLSSLANAEVRSFTILNGQPCRFIRIRQTSKTDGDYDHLVVTAWEIFGTLIG
jgi:hypothetical protein